MRGNRILPVLTGCARAALLFAAVAVSPAVRAEDGYDLWLRYRPVEAAQRQPYQSATAQIVGDADSAVLRSARAELTRGLTGLLGVAPQAVSRPTRDGALLIGTPRSSAVVAALQLDLRPTGREGYLIRGITLDGHRITVIAANADVGVLYGVFHYLRLLQTRQPLDRLDVISTPRLPHRVLDHWDNLDGSVERGYAGASIWDWQKLPDYLSPRYTDYARACASIGINGTVLTNVNASAFSLTEAYLRKAAALADVFRPFGLHVFLSARFSAPIEIGGLTTADPLDPAVQAWWHAKVDEIYRYIPDFGGLLVKADSEGQPGPQDYGRTHAEGANMLAAALAAHGGIVMWRAFVYSQQQPADRAMQAYAQFAPLDGKFRDNVLVQLKNGPIDFQPREPFHPLLGAMPKTQLLLELQITKEYLGFATHLAYLGALWEETLESDTYAQGPGSTVAKRIGAMAGVANIGADRNWTGSHFDQANWYAFGRLAWEPNLRSADIAEEWARMTFSNAPEFFKPVVAMMMTSRAAVVDYMTPLGLHHQMARGHHYGPGPWVSGGPRADWTSVYYNRADEQGIGFDRTSTGSNAVSQYAPEVAAKFADLQRTPQEYLLWFHHLRWDYRLPNGAILWDELVRHYTRGVQSVTEMRKIWAGLASYVDAERYAQVAAFLAIQEREAQWWRDASIAYFQSLSQRPLPEGYSPPAHSLQYYESLYFPYVPGNPGVPAAAGARTASVAFDWFEYQGHDPVFNQPLPPGSYRNPILTGFFPDPSITRAGDRFYLVSSTFTYFPGIPVFESADLVHWRQIGNVIDRPTQLQFAGLAVSRGVFAPSIHYHNGFFYVLDTAVDAGGNFLSVARNPAGPWSDPIWLTQVDGIDPSLFFDDDGRSYVLNNGPPPGRSQYDGQRAIWIQEFDLGSRRLLGPRKVLINGGVDFASKPVWIEGPHLFKREGWYYLMCAEGGTSTQHSEVVLRGRSPWGPFQADPGNPILTQRDLDPQRADPIAAAGHAQLVQAADGQWWATFLAVRTYDKVHYNLGRETFLLPVTWRDGWPVILPHGQAIPYVAAAPALAAAVASNVVRDPADAPALATPATSTAPTDLSELGARGAPTSGNFTWRDDFDSPSLGREWLMVRVPKESWMDLSSRAGWLTIHALPVSLDTLDNPSFLARRQQHMSFDASTALELPASGGVAAGMGVFQNEKYWYFFGTRRQNNRLQVFLEKEDGQGAATVASVTIPAGTLIKLKVSAQVRHYSFYYDAGNGQWQALLRDDDGSFLSTDVAGGFVGTVIGPYARAE